jgi:hypothetical protein
VNTYKANPILNRRRFLGVVATGSVVAAGGYALYEAAPWLNYDQPAAERRQPLAADSHAFVRMRELVRYATLAANGHNTQPWRFAVTENTIDIHPDAARRLQVVDRHDRELWISLGCALENLLVAARATGYSAEVTYPDAVDTIRVRFAADTARPSPLFDAIPLRQNTRSAFDGQPVPSADLRQAQSLPLEPGISLQIITDSGIRETVLDYVNQGNLRQYADSAFVHELIAWLRFNKREALATMDGLYSRCSGNPEVPRWLGQRFVAGTQPQQQADADAAKLRSASAIALIASATDDRASWVRTGQVYERLALATTTLNIKSAFLNQPIEVADLRAQFQSAMDLGASRPQLLMRMGFADAMPYSARRPVEQVIM